MKKLYLIIIYTITAICMLIGCLMYATNAFSFIPKKGETTGASLSDSIAFDGFESIEVDCSVMDFSIEFGDKYNLQYDCSKGLEPSCHMEDNTLCISQNKRKSRFKNNSKCRVIVTIPTDTKLTKLSINADVGNITLKDLTIENITNESDVGNITCENCTVTDTLSMNADVGNIDNKNCSFNHCEISADVGNVDIDSCTFTDLVISADTGDVKLSNCDNLDAYNIDLSTELGKIVYFGESHKHNFTKAGSASDKKLSITNDIGSIKISE